MRAGAPPRAPATPAAVLAACVRQHAAVYVASRIPACVPARCAPLLAHGRYFQRARLDLVPFIPSIYRCMDKERVGKVTFKQFLKVCDVQAIAARCRVRMWPVARPPSACRPPPCMTDDPRARRCRPCTQRRAKRT